MNAAVLLVNPASGTGAGFGTGAAGAGGVAGTGVALSNALNVGLSSSTGVGTGQQNAFGQSATGQGSSTGAASPFFGGALQPSRPRPFQAPGFVPPATGCKNLPLKSQE